MDTFTIAILTTDRNRNGRENYVFQTIKELEKSGVFKSDQYHSLTIHADGPANKSFEWKLRDSTKELPGVTVCVYETNAGSAGNALRAHKQLSESTATWSIVMEDDLLIADDFLTSLTKWLEKSYSEERLVYQIGVWQEYVKAYAMGSDGPYFDYYGHNETRGKQKYTLESPTDLLRGSQCYIMKPSDCKNFANYIDSIMKQQKQRRLIHHDMRLRHWLNTYHGTDTPGKAMLRSPCQYTFVQHIGKESSVYDVKKHIDPVFMFDRGVTR